MSKKELPQSHIWEPVECITYDSIIPINGFLCLELDNVGTGTVVILVKRRTMFQMRAECLHAHSR
jgi:hypothetical protein